MEITYPNECGVLHGVRETVARHGRAYAAISIALSDDGLYRYGIDLMYSYGGFGFPIRHDDEGLPSLDAARTAAMETLLRRWPSPLPSDPESVHAELRILREQVEARLRQPSLF